MSQVEVAHQSTESSVLPSWETNNRTKLQIMTFAFSGWFKLVNFGNWLFDGFSNEIKRTREIFFFYTFASFRTTSIAGWSGNIKMFGWFRLNLYAKFPQQAGICLHFTEETLRLGILGKWQNPESSEKTYKLCFSSSLSPATKYDFQFWKSQILGEQCVTCGENTRATENSTQTVANLSFWKFSLFEHLKQSCLKTED